MASLDTLWAQAASYCDHEGRRSATVKFWADGVVTVRRNPIFRFPVSYPRPTSDRKYRVRKRSVRASAYAIFSYSSKVYFVTMTFPDDYDERRRLDAVHRFAAYLSKEISAANGILGYLWVLERHASSKIHAHFVIGLDAKVRTKLWRRSLVDASLRWTGSKNGLDVRLVRSYKKVASYVTKYCTKNARNEDYYFSFRAYGFGGVGRYRVRVFRDVFVSNSDGVFFISPRFFLLSDGAIIEYLLSRFCRHLAPAAVSYLFRQRFLSVLDDFYDYSIVGVPFYGVGSQSDFSIPVFLSDDGEFHYSFIPYGPWGDGNVLVPLFDRFLRVVPPRYCSSSCRIFPGCLVDDRTQLRYAFDATPESFFKAVDAVRELLSAE